MRWTGPNLGQPRWISTGMTSRWIFEALRWCTTVLLRIIEHSRSSLNPSGCQWLWDDLPVIFLKPWGCQAKATSSSARLTLNSWRTWFRMEKSSWSEPPRHEWIFFFLRLQTCIKDASLWRVSSAPRSGLENAYGWCQLAGGSGRGDSPQDHDTSLESLQNDISGEYQWEIIINRSVY